MDYEAFYLVFDNSVGGYSGDFDFFFPGCNPVFGNFSIVLGMTEQVTGPLK